MRVRITGLPSVRASAAAALGTVMTTVRPVLTRYCFATRCTSAAVTLAMLSARVLMRSGLL